jgi:uncharacterized protein YndB with AHSA1/START domain
MAELVITRVFDAPRQLVWKAFTDPDQLAAWYGPVGWSVPRDTVTVDLRVGGSQRFTMVDDADPARTSPVAAVFTEVVENELLVAYEDLDDETFGKVRLETRIELHDEGGDRTRVVLRQGPFTEEIEGSAREGWTSSFTKLDALLAR